MQVLHAVWFTGAPRTPRQGFFFWAEASPDGRPQRKPLQGTVARHPYVRSAAALRSHAELGHYLTGGVAGSERLLLPTVDGAPVLSPALATNGVSATPSGMVWIVPGVRLAADSAALALVSLPSAPGALRGTLVGDDLLYWRHVAGLAIEAVAAQKLLPCIEQDDRGRHRCRWRALLHAAQDDARVARLCQAMPPVCRARPDGDGRYRAAAALLGTVIDDTVDALVRRWAPSPAQPAGSDDLSPPQGADAAIAAWAENLFLSADAPPRDVHGVDWEQCRLCLDKWTRPLHIASGSDFRAAFRLEAPSTRPDDDKGQDGSPNWRLHYSLQSRSDPSLLIPASEVWAGGGQNATRMCGPREREVLLTALGCAARAFPPITQSLKSSGPEACSLATEQAYSFLREAAPVLEQSGFAVLVPPWWASAKQRLRRRLRLRPSSSATTGRTGSGIRFERLVSFEWQIALGDTVLSPEEFASLAALKSPLVQIRGEWVRLDPDQVSAAIAFWQAEERATDVGILEAMRLATVGEDSASLPVDEITAEGWLDDWLGRFTGRAALEPLPQPKSLRGVLRPYQVHGYSWLQFLRRYGIGGILADDMGLGKTVQTLALFLREKDELGRLPGPSLLVAPTSVVANWESEARRFAPTLSTVVHQGDSRAKGEEIAAAVADVDLVLTSYALLRRDAAALREIAWHGVILDEAQNIKNPSSAQSQAARALKADFRFALTGTPIENRLSELWSIMSFLNPGYLGSQEGFQRRIATPIERYGDSEATAHLQRMVGPLILRRTKTDPRVAPDLPDKVETKERCRLTEEQATLYEAVVRDAMRQVEESAGIRRRGLVLSMLMQLKQVCNHPLQYLHQVGRPAADAAMIDRSGKFARLAELLEEIAAVRERTLIFTQFSEMASLLTTFIDGELGYTTLTLTGQTPVAKRQQLVERFQAAGNGPLVFVISVKAGGTGLNLTGAGHVIHFDRWWNPAVEDQATDRAYRIGQHRNVQVHKFVCVGTLEETIDELIESKRALAQSIVGGGESWLTELSTEDLRQLVELRL